MTTRHKLTARWLWRHAREYYHLNISLYGLDQSGQQSAGLLVEIVIAYGMDQSINQSRTDLYVIRMVVDRKKNN